MAKRYLVTLTETERAHLLTLITKGQGSARKLNRAHTLLQADAGATDEVMAAALHRGIATVERLRTRVVEAGVESALTERARPGGRRKLNGRQEAFLIALACRPPPEGRQCWPMPILADTLVELQLGDGISDETVRRTLQEMSSRLGRRRAGVFPV